MGGGGTITHQGAAPPYKQISVWAAHQKICWFPHDFDSQKFCFAKILGPKNFWVYTLQTSLRKNPDTPQKHSDFLRGVTSSNFPIKKILYWSLMDCFNVSVAALILVIFRGASLSRSGHVSQSVSQSVRPLELCHVVITDSGVPRVRGGDPSQAAHGKL